MKHFLFMYPIDKILDVEISLKHDLARDCLKTMNECIDRRYRQKGFKINYAVFDDLKVSEGINVKDSDRIIRVGMTSGEHYTDKQYPKPNYTFIELENPTKLVVAGFHMWDCVERFAKAAYNKGIDTLVDEDLTEFFFSKMERKDQDFLNNLDKYPTYNPYTDPMASEGHIHDFMEARKDNPWLWQNYSKNGFVKDTNLKIRAGM